MLNQLPLRPVDGEKTSLPFLFHGGGFIAL